MVTKDRSGVEARCCLDRGASHQGQQRPVLEKSGSLQATERAYACFLLTVTLYLPKSHNIKFLRSLSESKDPCLIDTWPRASKADPSRFELLKRAYVEACYSLHYRISVEELEVLMTSVRRLRDLVERVCREWLEGLGGEERGQP